MIIVNIRTTKKNLKKKKIVDEIVFEFITGEGYLAALKPIKM